MNEEQKIGALLSQVSVDEAAVLDGLKQRLLRQDSAPKTPKGARRKGKRNGSRSAGPMQFRFKDIQGQLVIEDSGGPGGFPPPETIVQRRLASSDNLWNIVTVNGDFRTPNPQQYTHELYSTYSGVVSTTFPGRSVVARGYISYPWNPLRTVGWNGMSASAYNDALGDLIEQIRGSLDLSVDVAESLKTRDMMRKTYLAMKAFVKGFSGLKRVVLSNRLKTLKKVRDREGGYNGLNPQDLGNKWLEYTYGWKPLVTDAYEAYENLMLPNTKTGTHVIVGRGRDKAKKVTSVASLYGFGTETKVAETDYRCTIAARFDFKPSQLSSLAGFTSLNPVSLAWELVPYSFVVDWFVNIGGYLRAAESMYLYSDNFVLGYSTETERTICTGKVIGSQVRSDGTGTVDAAIAYSSYQGTNKLRRKLLEMPGPRIPPFNPRLGSSRLISAASLLSQFVKSWK